MCDIIIHGWYVWNLYVFFIQRKEELADKKRLAQQKKMKQATEEAKLFEQAKRNAARHRQECAELAAYERQYGKVRHIYMYMQCIYNW